MNCFENKPGEFKENAVDEYINCFVKKSGICLNKYVEKEKVFIHITIPVSGLVKVNQNKVRIVV